MTAGQLSSGREACLLRIRSRYPSLRQSEQKVADYVLAHPEEVIDLSIAELGRKAGVSDAAVVRFSQTLGYPGYWGLRIALARDVASTSRQAPTELSDGNSPAAIKTRIFHSSIQALTDTATILDPQQLEMAAVTISACRKLLFIGVGASGLVAMDAHYKFSRIGLNAFSYLDLHLQAAIASTLGPKDAVVAISHSGETNMVVTALRLAKDNGAKCICITNYSNSPVAQVSDIVLLTASSEKIFRTSAMSSRIAQLAVIDALYEVTLSKRQEDSPDNLEQARRAVATLES